MRTLEQELTCAVDHLAKATRIVEKLPHSERRALMYGMICNQGKVLTLLLELAKQEKEETCKRP